MDAGADNLPVEIESEAGPLLSTLLSMGWMIVSARYDSGVMGKWSVDLARDAFSLQLVKDRSQFFITGPPAEELRVEGLLRAFDNIAELQQAVINWAGGDAVV